MKIEEINYSEKKYPEKLKAIYDPPKKIYVLGNSKLLSQKNIAIVGSRKATQYGKSVAFKFANELSKQGINIVSGLAIGIDTFAHLGTLQPNCLGKTIAVLANGFDELYPSENKELAGKIIKSGGCLVSEFPLRTKAEKINFPQRNRIISALSEAVVIVEAGLQSGALITADFALEQGKEVFAVPGNITSEFSLGTNELIKQGATIVTNYLDIISVYKE